MTKTAEIIINNNNLNGENSATIYMDLITNTNKEDLAEFVAELYSKGLLDNYLGLDKTSNLT